MPIGLVAVAASYFVLPPASRHSQGGFDFIGAVLLGVGVAGLNLGLSFGQEWGWTSPLLILTLVISAGALVGAVLYERRAASPLLDLRLFHNRVFFLGSRQPGLLDAGAVRHRLLAAVLP